MRPQTSSSVGGVTDPDGNEVIACRDRLHLPDRRFNFEDMDCDLLAGFFLNLCGLGRSFLGGSLLSLRGLEFQRAEGFLGR